MRLYVLQAIQGTVYFFPVEGPDPLLDRAQEERAVLPIPVSFSASMNIEPVQVVLAVFKAAYAMLHETFRPNVSCSPPSFGASLMFILLF